MTEHTLDVNDEIKFCGQAGCIIRGPGHDSIVYVWCKRHEIYEKASE